MSQPDGLSLFGKVIVGFFVLMGITVAVMTVMR